MKFREIQEACWAGYRQAGMKKKGDRQVPNCVPVEEVKTGPDMTLNDLLYTAAAKAMHQAGLEGVPMDYDEAIKKAAKIYRIPYTPSELPKLLAQRDEIDRKLAMMKQGKQVAKQRRKEKLAPTPAGAEEYWRTHALPTDRIKPPAKTLEEYTGDPFIDNAARELLGFVLMFGVPFAVGTYINIRNKLRKYEGKEIIDALERKGVTMNRQTYDRVKPVLDRFDQAIRDDDGTEAKALAKQIEQMIIMGKLSATEPQAPADSALVAKEKELAEDLKKWFKEKWVRFGPDGKIRGDCARGSSKEGKPKCLPQSKAHALGKKGRASAAAKKRREDPNPERRGPARNVATKVREQGVAEGLPQTLRKVVPGYAKREIDKKMDAEKFGRRDVDRDANFWRYKKIQDKLKEQGVAEGFEYGNRVQHPKYGAGQVIKVYSNGQITVNFPNYPDPIDKKPGVQPTFGPGDRDYQSLKPLTGIKEQHDWDDADEFGMPGSEFFPDDDRLRDGDYVRDRQDGEYGEIFRMSGDPSERRVRILDRDGKGWYISPERLVAVDRDDPDIMRYFGKRRQRDMDESAVAEGFEYGTQVQHPKYGAGQVIKVYSNGQITVNFPNYPDPIDKKPGVQPTFGPGDKDYQSLKPMVSEKQDACYRKVKSRYKVWPSAYASGALVQCRKKGAANWGNKKK